RRGPPRHRLVLRLPARRGGADRRAGRLLRRAGRHLPRRRAGRPPADQIPRRRGGVVTTAAEARAQRWIALGLLCVAQFVVVLDASSVNVALPTIKGALDFSEDSLPWVVNAYVLTFGGFLLLGGRLADLLGRRRLFMGGLVLFALASLAGGLAS